MTHAVDIEIEAGDRAGLLQDVMGVCAELKTTASSVTARVEARHRGDRLTLQIRDLDHLHKILTSSNACAKCAASIASRNARKAQQALCIHRRVILSLSKEWLPISGSLFCGCDEQHRGWRQLPEFSRAHPRRRPVDSRQCNEQRRDVGRYDRRRTRRTGEMCCRISSMLYLMLAISIVGAILGATLLLLTPPAAFNRLIPWLLLFATLIFAASPLLTQSARWRSDASMVAVHRAVSRRGVRRLLHVRASGS